MMTAQFDSSPLVLKTRSPAPLRLAQITDCHLFANAESCLQGMNTRKSFEAVCALIDASEVEFDLLLATGDLAQDGSAEAYRYLATAFNRYSFPTCWIPGNHDNYESMKQHLRAERVVSSKHVVSDHWQIVMLNSTIPDMAHGNISESQLDFLDQTLQSFPDKHALVCLHHQALAAGSLWIDGKGLKNDEELRQRLSQHRHLRGVLWGHVHQESQRSIGDVKWMSTPSSCIQFKPGSEEFTIDDRPPGYRRLDFHADGRIESSVYRLSNSQLERLL